MGRTPPQITARPRKRATGVDAARGGPPPWFPRGCRLRQRPDRPVCGRRYPGWAPYLPLAGKSPAPFPWRVSCIVRAEAAEQGQYRTRFRDLLGGLRPAARGVETMPARREKLAFSGRCPDRSAVGAPVWPADLDRTPAGPRQSVAAAPRLTTLRPKCGTYALGRDSAKSSPGCGHRIDSQLRLETIQWADCSADGMPRR